MNGKAKIQDPFEGLFEDASARALSRVGVVDVGSNSIRLVIFDGAARSPAYFYNEKVMAGLGKDMAATKATMGQMRWRSEVQDGEEIGTLMIRHPNFSGLQRDQVTLLNIPAHFIDRLDVRQGDALLFSMAAGISVSEDPVFRFRYQPDGQPINVRVEDTDGNVWTESFPPGERTVNKS